MGIAGREMAEIVKKMSESEFVEFLSKVTNLLRNLKILINLNMFFRGRLEKNKTQIEKILTLSACNLLEIGKVLSLFLPESGAKIVEILSEIKITKAKVLFACLEL